MRRREFIALAGAAAAWPLSVVAQQAGKVYRIGFVANDPTIPTQSAGRAFLDSLRESGFVEGKNIVIERRFAEGRLDRYADILTELIQMEVDVIVTSSSNATLAAKSATTKIPIVMMNVIDPIGLGIVTSLAHPEGNITGVVQDDTGEITTKRAQLLKDTVPNTSQVAVLINSGEPSAYTELKYLELTAQVLHMTMHAIEVKQPGQFQAAFDRMIRERVDALFIVASGLFLTHRQLITELAAERRLPVMSSFREITEVGGLISYSSVRVDRFRQAAIYVGKVLKGARPADLPIEQPTKFELIINVKTAKALGLTIPPTLLVQADEVIE